MIIKSAARRNWPEPVEHTYTTWYEPFDDQDRITAAVAWVLAHDEVTGIATPGDVRLLPLVSRPNAASARSPRPTPRPSWPAPAPTAPRSSTSRSDPGPAPDVLGFLAGWPG
jgi:hypothetical protein